MTSTATRIATADGAALVRGTPYDVTAVPALVALAASDAAVAEHIDHSPIMEFGGWGQRSGRPTFRCACGQLIATMAQDHPMTDHVIGCAVQSGIACDCRLGRTL